MLSHALAAATHQAPAYVRGEPAQRLMVILRAPGCAFDRRAEGGCNYCGFRHLTTDGRPVTTEDYLAQVSQALAKHASAWPEIREIDIYNSGNFLNDAEVPAEARAGIFKLCAEVPGVRLIVAESRPEYVHLEKVIAMREAAVTELDLAIGLETYDDTLRTRLQKRFSRADFERAVRTLSHAGIGLLTYLMLKPCQMSDQAALDDVIRAAEYVHGLAAELGIPVRIALEPAFVPPATPLATEYLAGAYQPPSLWLVREAAQRLARLGEVTVGLWDETLDPLAVPSSCPDCRDRLVDALRRFNLTQQADTLDVAPCSCGSDQVASLRSNAS